MNEVTIRAYQPDDKKDVVALWELVFADDPAWNRPEDVIKQKLSVQPELFLVAEYDGRIVGTTLAGYDGVRGWLHHVATHPDYQRTGVAEKLIEQAQLGLKKYGCVKLNLQVRSSNADVVAFYQRLGFEVEERISLGKPLVD